MSNNKSEYRRKNGGKLEGRALAARIAQEVNGMMLAQAYVAVKSAGFHLQINKLDGVLRQGYVPVDGDKVMVDVISGFVSKSWAAD
jgi:hypothetical protein